LFAFRLCWYTVRGNPGDGKPRAKANVMNANQSLRMLLSFSEAAPKIRLQSRFPLASALALRNRLVRKQALGHSHKSRQSEERHCVGRDLGPVGADCATRFDASSVETSTFFCHDDAIGVGNSARDQTDCNFSLQIQKGPRSA
jgi:hypothetical protein